MCRLNTATWAVLMIALALITTAVAQTSDEEECRLTFQAEGKPCEDEFPFKKKCVKTGVNKFDCQVDGLSTDGILVLIALIVFLVLFAGILCKIWPSCFFYGYCNPLKEEALFGELALKVWLAKAKDEEERQALKSLAGVLARSRDDTAAVITHSDTRPNAFAKTRMSRAVTQPNLRRLESEEANVGWSQVVAQLCPLHVLVRVDSFARF